MRLGSPRYPLAAVVLLSAACAHPEPSPPNVPAPAAPDPLHDLLVAPEACKQPPARAVSRADALADLEVVERVVASGYAGFDVLARGGLDWRALFAKAREQVQSRTDPLPAEDLRLLLLAALAPARDGHLAFWIVTRTLVVLVDGECASACESLVSYARQVPGTLVVGENTAGVGVFGEVRPYRLPRSGIWMQAGRKWFHDADPARAIVEGVGHQPDIWLDGGDLRLRAETIARCAQRQECAAALRSAVRRQEVLARQQGLDLRAMSWNGQVLEGEVVNLTTDRVAREVVVEVTWSGEAGKPLLTKELRVVPGGDGRALDPGHAKRFRFAVGVGGAGSASPSGKIKRIDWAP